MNEFIRSYPVEDIRILTRAQGNEYADGRTVEAYVSVFGREAEIHDAQGHYVEVIDPKAFNKAIADAKPQGSRTAWRTGVFYNHGLTIHGTPSDRFSLPLGSPVDIRADTAGLLTVTRYNNNTLADEILESIRSGDITGHSFTGQIVRSSPAPSRRGYERRKDNSLQTVKRLELGLREYGPTPFPAYIDTQVVGVRSLLASLSAQLSTTHLDEFEDEPVDSDTSPHEEAVTDEPTAAGHSSRETQRATLHQRIEAAIRTRPGLAWQKEETS